MRFEVIHGNYDPNIDNGTKQGKKAAFCCPFCNNGLVNGDYIDSEANNGRMGSVLMAIVVEGPHGRTFLSPNYIDSDALNEEITNYYQAYSVEEKVPHAESRGTFASNAQGRRYGFFEFKDYFTSRQLITLSTFTNLLSEIQNRVERDATLAELKNDHIPLNDNGNGALAYAQAIAVYLSFGVDKLTDRNSNVCSWMNGTSDIRPVFARQAIPIAWDYAEANPFSNSVGCWDNVVGWLIDALKTLVPQEQGYASQANAQEDCNLREIMVSTDPPYYDNICYSDLSDFYYVWMRQMLRNIYPSLFSTLLVPKKEELIASSYRHSGSVEKAKSFFENGMLQTCQQIYTYTRNDIPVTIYYAYKQSDENENNSGQASTGWETMLSAIIKAGFSITGTWPVRTERSGRPTGNGANALASSIVLVCRKRILDAKICTRRNFINELKHELRPALQKLQSSNIAPVDLAQSAIGPGIGVYSKYSQVFEADGTPMTVRSALKIINQELDLYLNEQDSDLDSESRFCIDLYSQYAFNEILFGDANTLATAKNTSVAIMASHGILYAQKGKVHLTERANLSETIDEHENCIWLLCQQLTYKMEKEGVEGCATVISNMFGSNAERAKDLAYRLYTIAERKKWAQEAYAYNALVVAWPEIQSRSAELKSMKPQQLSIFE